MQASLVLEDTPQGISAELRWVGNDTTDHLADSLSMMMMVQFTETMKAQARLGAIRLAKD